MNKYFKISFVLLLLIIIVITIHPTNVIAFRDWMSEEDTLDSNLYDITLEKYVFDSSDDRVKLKIVKLDPNAPDLIVNDSSLGRILKIDDEWYLYLDEQNFSIKENNIKKNYYIDFISDEIYFRRFKKEFEIIYPNSYEFKMYPEYVLEGEDFDVTIKIFNNGKYVGDTHHLNLNLQGYSDLNPHLIPRPGSNKNYWR